MNSGRTPALAKIAAMTPNVTAVSYGPKLTASELEQLRSVLAGNGAIFQSESRGGDSRFEVHTAELAVADSTDSGIAALRHAVAEAAQDQYLQLEVRRAAASGERVRTRPQAWAHGRVCRHAGAGTS